MEVVITGGAGLQGSKLAERLVREGHTVFVADNFMRGQNHVTGVAEVRIDLRSGNLEGLFRNVDVVFHLAAHVGGVEYVGQNDQKVMLDNLRVDSNVIHYCIQAGVKKFIYASTACVYPVGEQTEWDSVLREDMAFSPVSPESGYGWAKLTGEVQLLKVRTMEVGILRLFNVYGPGEDYEPGSHVIPELIRKALDENPVMPVYGTGEAGRCFLYAEDAVDAYILMMEKGMGKGPINIGSPSPIRIKDLAQRILDLAGRSKRLEFQTDKPTGVMGRVPDLRRASEILGWKAITPFNEGLSTTINWVKSKQKG